MQGRSTAFCVCIFILFVGTIVAQSPTYRGMAEKSTSYEVPLNRISAYIKDQQCYALIGHLSGMIPCEPDALRVEVLDFTAFPEVAIVSLDQLPMFSYVTRRGGCNGVAQVNISYSCKLFNRRNNGAVRSNRGGPLGGSLGGSLGGPLVGPLGGPLGGPRPTNDANEAESS